MPEPLGTAHGNRSHRKTGSRTTTTGDHLDQDTGASYLASKQSQRQTTQSGAPAPLPHQQSHKAARPRWDPDPGRATRPRDRDGPPQRFRHGGARPTPRSEKSKEASARDSAADSRSERATKLQDEQQQQQGPPQAGPKRPRRDSTPVRPAQGERWSPNHTWGEAYAEVAEGPKEVGSQRTWVSPLTSPAPGREHGGRNHTSRALTAQNMRDRPVCNRLAAATKAMCHEERRRR